MEKQLKSIEFLRIIGCLAVICLHLSYYYFRVLFPDITLYKRLVLMTADAQKAVDLFFMISGLFFALYFNKEQSLCDFMKRKVIRVYPVAIFIVFTTFLFSLAGILRFYLLPNILVLLNLLGTPMAIDLLGKTQISAFWYVSSMLWALGLYYYLLKNYDKRTGNLIIFLTVFFCYSFLICAKEGKFNSPQKTFCYIFNVGLMRGFAGIGVGYFIGEWWKKDAKKIKNKVIKNYKKIIITLFEILGLSFIVRYLLFHRLNLKNDMIFIFVFGVTIALFLINKGYISQLLNNSVLGSICAFFAKYSYGMYMIHLLVFNVMKKTFWQTHSEFVYSYPLLNLLFTLGLVFVAGVLVYHFVENPCTRFLKRYFLKDNKV